MSFPKRRADRPLIYTGWMAGDQKPSYQPSKDRDRLRIPALNQKKIWLMAILGISLAVGIATVIVLLFKGSPGQMKGNPPGRSRTRSGSPAISLQRTYPSVFERQAIRQRSFRSPVRLGKPIVHFLPHELPIRWFSYQRTAHHPQRSITGRGPAGRGLRPRLYPARSIPDAGQLRLLR